jgi:hypothetical protein
MNFKTKDFLIDRETAKVDRVRKRFDNFLDDLDRCKDSRSNRMREENFLLNEAHKVLTDPTARRSEKAFAGIVYQIISEWLIDGLQEDE